MRGEAADRGGRHRDGLSAYDRALAEPRFLRAVRNAYAGPADLLDALWWLDHPLEPGPSGARPPAAAAAEARRALYGRTPPANALERYRAAADLEAETRSAVAAALSAIGADRPPLPRRLLGAAEPEPEETSRKVAPAGRWEEVFSAASGSPRVAPLLRLPRATVYAVETRPPSACLFLLSDEGDFQGATASVAEFERRGVVLQVESPLDGSIGLVRVEWSPSGEVRWETRPVEPALGALWAEL